MTALIAAILGTMSSALPELFKLWVDQLGRKHELEVMDKQATASQATAQAQSEAEQLKAQYATFYSGVGWVDALNGLVRPVIAFSFFGLYCYTKYIAAGIITPGLPWTMDTFWGEEDVVLFSWVIAFYFGTRGFSKRS